MRQEDQPQELSDPHRQWWPWLLSGAVLGIVLGSSFGAAIGLAAEGLVVLLVNRLPDERVRTILGAICLIGCGALAGACGGAVLSSYMKSKQELLMFTILGRGEELIGLSDWMLCGGAIGGVIAAVDRLFMWVIFPHGVETPDDSPDALDPELDPDD